MNAELLVDVRELRRNALASFRPPPKLSLSEWADRYFYLSAESAAEPGRWKTLPYQRGMMDAVTDPTVERITVMKSARVGYTKLIDAAIGMFIHYDPCSMLAVQPTVDDAKGFSKDEIAPMLRDVPVLAGIVHDDPDTDDGPREGGNTMLRKSYPGGKLHLVGANSGTGFRRITVRVVFFDEVDGYPPSAGSDGDQIKLGEKRAETFWNRKIISGSTPLVKGKSRIEDLFEQGDQRRYYVPCPHCEHMGFLVFAEDRGGPDTHWMSWPKGRPKEAVFNCRACGCEIEHKEKRRMVERGEWRAAKPFAGHASFHIWTAYSPAPNATWGHIASEWVEAQGDPKKLKTVVNTTLGETWVESGETPDWEKLYNRREHWGAGTVPYEKTLFLTAGVDVQRDRFVYEVVGWANDKRSWSVEAGVLMAESVAAGITTKDFEKLDALLTRTYPTPSASALLIQMLAIDSGAFTQEIYDWARRYPLSRVIATKGVSGMRSSVGPAVSVEIKPNGKRLARGYKMFPLGVDLIKSELYGFLQLPQPSVERGEAFPPGYCFFPEHPEEFFKQLTAEQLVAIPHKRTGFLSYEWQLIPQRQNHWLDARVYARAAATVLGLDRIAAAAAASSAPAAPAAPSPQPAEPIPAAPASAAPSPQPKGNFLGLAGIGPRLRVRRT